MRYQIEDIIFDLKNKLEKDKSLRNRVFLEHAITNLTAYHEETKRKIVE